MNSVSACCLYVNHIRMLPFTASLFCGRMVSEEQDREVPEHTRQSISCKKPPGWQHYVDAPNLCGSPSTQTEKPRKVLRLRNNTYSSSELKIFCMLPKHLLRHNSSKDQTNENNR
ncbi:jg13513 [Pararge aegeria aegeria]|uniref:Jg13513 protein n=1 Tax=Pararge aegeria aegeria TaxID=348720 RepID=A0A8S4QSV7_9NEOP|nr:jg13513 [Pararge aegeria aegeria]